MKLAYIIGSYPALTTTFIDREVLLLREWGVDLRIFSIRRSKSKLSGAQKEIQQEVTYLLPVNLWKLFAAHLLFGFQKPITYFKVLFYLLGQPHPNLKARMKTIFHFGEGVYAAYWMRQASYEHIHAHFADRAATIALVASRLLGIRYSLTAHAMDIYVEPVLLPEKIGGAAFVATCTAYNQAYLHSLIANGAKEKIKCIYHGLDTRPYVPAVSGNLSEGETMLLAVGQLKEKKGFTYLLQACRNLREAGYGFTCQIVGDGPLREDLEGQISLLGLDGTVELCGALPHEEVIEKYAQASIFVLPAVTSSDGDRDGIPNVILEALTMHLPVVSTNHSGIPEVISHGENGLLVKSKDVQALTDALASLMEQPALRKQLGQHGRKIVLEKFDLPTNISALYAEFQHVMEEN
jgi:glycosyltransferase involved in cell wall biosynthesis